MVHEIDRLRQSVDENGRVVTVDITITSLDRDGEEDLEPPVKGLHILEEVWVVGRETGDRTVIQWKRDTNTLLVTKPNGNVETAGSSLGPFRLRMEGPR